MQQQKFFVGSLLKPFLNVSAGRNLLVKNKRTGGSYMAFSGVWSLCIQNELSSFQCKAKLVETGVQEKLEETPNPSFRSHNGPFNGFHC